MHGVLQAFDGCLFDHRIDGLNQRRDMTTVHLGIQPQHTTSFEREWLNAGSFLPILVLELSAQSKSCLCRKARTKPWKGDSMSRVRITVLKKEHYPNLLDESFPPGSKGREEQICPIFKEGRFLNSIPVLGVGRFTARFRHDVDGTS